MPSPISWDGLATWRPAASDWRARTRGMATKLSTRGPLKQSGVALRRRRRRIITVHDAGPATVIRTTLMSTRCIKKKQTRERKG